MNLTAIEEYADKTVLKILENVTGGWPAAKGDAWQERDFSWTEATIRARKLGVDHDFFLIILPFPANLDAPVHLAVS